MSRFKNKLSSMEESLSFDDLLIKPNFSDVSLENVSLKVCLNDTLSLSIPVFSAGMDTITGYEMARAMISCGACGPLHKNTTIDENVSHISKLRDEFGPSKPISVCVGVGNTVDEIGRLVEAGANVIVVDSAHGHTKNVGALVQMISKQFPNVYLIAGNVVTKEGAEWLISNGAHAVKVGLGPGSICTTRKVTGIGRGQVSSILEVADYCKSKGIKVIADGGISSTDDIMKAIACGADAVMVGFLLAGCYECPGDSITIDEQEYKTYRGMGSVGAMKMGSSGRYGKENIDKFKWVPEGVESFVPIQGSVKDKLHVIEWSLRSAFGYVGANNLTEAQEKTELVKLTFSSKQKSGTHGISIIRN